MKSKLKRAVTFLALLGASTGVAHATEGWYGRVDAGYSIDGELDVDQATDSLDFEDDWMFSGGVGYAFLNGFRLEGELSYRTNDVEEIVQIIDEGEVEALAGMANLYYDFNRGGRFEPYVGVGVGGVKLDANAVFNGFNDVFDSDDTVVAYQALVGVAIGLTERLDLDIGYRYFIARRPRSTACRTARLRRLTTPTTSIRR